MLIEHVGYRANPNYRIFSTLPYSRNKSQAIEEFSHRNYDKIKVIEIFSDTYPDAAQKVMNGFFARGYDLQSNNCLTATNDVLTAYGDKNLPSAFDNALGTSTTPISYFNQLAGEETNLKSGAGQGSDTSMASANAATGYAATEISQPLSATPNAQGLNISNPYSYISSNKTLIKEWAQSVKGSTRDIYNNELGLYYDAAANKIKYLNYNGKPSTVVSADATNYMNGDAI